MSIYYDRNRIMIKPWLSILKRNGALLYQYHDTKEMVLFSISIMIQKWLSTVSCYNMIVYHDTKGCLYHAVNSYPDTLILL